MIKSIAATHPGPTPETAITVGLTGIDLALWTCLMAGLLLARVAPAFGPALSPDSFQYLSAAANFLHGAPGHTSLVHYDVERSFGVVPAPMVTFALGYPILIASLGLLGASLPLAAWIVSAASTVAAVPVLASMARRLGLSRGLCHAVIGAFVVNGAVVEFGDSALSEAPFALCVLLGAALLLQAGDATGRRARLRWAGAGAAFAAAYTIRYAGLFFIVGLAVLTLRHALTRHPMRARGHAIALGVSLVPVVVVIARNFALVGNWRGRDEMLVHNPWPAALNETVQAINALLLGSGTSTATPAGTFVFKIAFVALVVAGVLLLAWSAARHRAATAGARPRTDDAERGIDLLILAALYAACMFYAGVTTSISYGSARNLVPIAGLLVLLFGWGIGLAQRRPAGSPRFERIALVLLGASLLPYAYLNALVSMRHPIDASAGVRAQMDEHADGKKTMREAIFELAGPDGVIMANNGQAVGHVLGAKAVSLVGPAFSTMVWDEGAVQSAIQRFNVRAVVITLPTAGRPADEALASPFVRRLAQGASPPWLTLALRSDGVLVYVPQRPAR